MILKVFSRTHPDRLLHVIFTAETEIDSDRVNLSPAAEALQISWLRLPEGRTVSPHKHVPQTRVSEITQESWIVLRGAIDVKLFDLDDALVETRTLTAGSVLLSLYGGHALAAGRGGAVMIECKNGPYRGRDHVPVSGPESAGGV